MASRRFRFLERDRKKKPTTLVGDLGLAHERFRRRLERDGEVHLDRSGALKSHFCQHCEAENPPASEHCFNCGGSLGGPEQAAFDAAMRIEREADRHAAGEAAARAVQEVAEQQRIQTVQTRTQSALSVREDRRLRRFFAAATLGVCLFATSLASVHLLSAAVTRAPVAWLPFLEIVVSVSISVWAFRHFHAHLSDL